MAISYLMNTIQLKDKWYVTLGRVIVTDPLHNKGSQHAEPPYIPPSGEINNVGKGEWCTKIVIDEDIEIEIETYLESGAYSGE